MVEGADSGVEIWVLHGDEKRGLVYQDPFFIRKKLPGAGSVGIKMIYLYGRISSVYARRISPTLHAWA